MNRLGIIAGGGDLPHIAMNEALRCGEDPLFLSVKESEFYTGDFSDRNIPVYITQIGGLIKTCKKNGIERLLLLGKVNKDIILKSYKFDLKAVILMAKMLNKNDYTFFEIAAKEFEKSGITIISQKTYLKPLFLTPGRYTKKKLGKSEIEDIQYGKNLSSELARLDIGQTVIVMDRMTLALEAIEGTDRAIERGGELSRGKGATVCKNSKAGQDERFDLPTVGLRTLESMKKHKYKTLAFRSENTLVVNPKELIAAADREKIHIVSFSEYSSSDDLNHKKEYSGL